MNTPKGKRPVGRNIELAKIHMAAASLKLITPGDDSAYRDMLWSIARVRSAKDLDIQGRQSVLDHLKSCGWKDSRPFVHRQSGADLRPQVAKIRALWAALNQGGHLNDGSDRALRAYVRRMSVQHHPQHVGYSSPELLPKGAAQHVIECLKRWCQRLGVPTE